MCKTFVGRSFTDCDLFVYKFICDLEPSEKWRVDTQPKDSDSLTNLFEYPDANGCEAETHEEPISDDGLTSEILKAEENAAASFTDANETDAQTYSEEAKTRLEDSDDCKVPEEPESDLSRREDSELPELPETEQHETQEHEKAEETRNGELQHHEDLHAERVSGTAVPSVDSPAKETLSAVEPTTCELTEIPHARSEDGQVSAPSSQLIEAGEPHFDEISDGRTAAESFEADTPLELETKDSETTSPAVPPLSTAASADDLRPEKTSETDVPCADSPAEETLSSAELPTCELTEISHAQGANVQVSAASSELIEAEPQLGEVREDRTAAESFEAEAALEPETKDSKTTSPAVPPLSTVAPDEDLRPEKTSETHVPCTDSPVKETLSPAELPTCELIDIPHAQGENGQVPAPSSQLVEAVEPQLDEVSEDRTAPESFAAETPLEPETKDSETTSPAVPPLPPLSTAAPDGLAKIDSDIHFVNVPTSGLDAVISKISDGGELSVGDQRNFEPTHTVDESSPVLASEDERNASSAPAASEQPCDNEEALAHLQKLESPMDTAAAVPTDDDDGGKMSAEPATQSVLSARDIFIEQQVSKYQTLDLSFTVNSFFKKLCIL